MITKIYTVFDTVVGAHLQPFFARSEGEAIRLLKQAVNDKNSGFHSNPSDYNLCYLGQFHDDTGEIQVEEKQTLINLLSLTDTAFPHLGSPLAQ